MTPIQPTRFSLGMLVSVATLCCHQGNAHDMSSAQPAARVIDLPVGERLHPARIFLDAAWARSQIAPAEAASLASEAFLAAQLAQRSISGASINQMVARLTVGDGARASALRRRQEIAEEINALQQALTAATSEGNVSRLKDGSRRLIDLIEQRDLQDTDLAKTYPDFSRLILDSPVTADLIARNLAAEEALIYVANGDVGVYLFTVTREGVSWHRVELSSVEVERDVASLRCELQIPTCGSSDEVAEQYDRSRAYRLYRALFEPAAATLRDKTSLITIPNRSLSRFPLAALVTEETSPADDGDLEALKRTPWLIDKYALTTTPSPSAFYHLRTLPPQRRVARTFRGFGNPVLDDPPKVKPLTRSALSADADVMRVQPGLLKKKFSDLPFTGWELDQMRIALNAPPQSVTTGADATERLVKTSSLEGVDVIAFATHGVLGGEVPEIPEPSLIFTPPTEPSAIDDGVFTASEAAKLKLTAQIVILSACNTAGPGDSEGPAVEGLSGLARGFFLAGARSLLASHWPVYDEVSARLTVSVIKSIEGEKTVSTALALQRAMIAIRKEPTKDWGHPSAWAPLVLVGE